MILHISCQICPAIARPPRDNSPISSHWSRLNHLGFRTSTNSQPCLRTQRGLQAIYHPYCLMITSMKSAIFHPRISFFGWMAEVTISLRPTTQGGSISHSCRHAPAWSQRAPVDCGGVQCKEGNGVWSLVRDHRDLRARIIYLCTVYIYICILYIYVCIYIIYICICMYVYI